MQAVAQEQAADSRLERRVDARLHVARDGAEQQLAPFSAALGAAPTPESVAQLATPARAIQLTFLLFGCCNCASARANTLCRW